MQTVTSEQHRADSARIAHRGAHALQHDPNETTGLDGALRRLLAHVYGPFLVILVAVGFAAFGVYSLARAYVNRDQVAHR